MYVCMYIYICMYVCMCVSHAGSVMETFPRRMAAISHVVNLGKRQRVFPAQNHVIPIRGAKTTMRTNSLNAPWQTAIYKNEFPDNFCL